MTTKKEKATARTTATAKEDADPYGMTTKKEKATARTTATATEDADPYGMTIKKEESSFMNPSDNADEQSEYVTVGEFLEPSEAQMAKGALEAEGIEVFLQGENANGLIPGAFHADLQVHERDEVAARELLEADRTNEPLEDDAV